MSAAEHGWAMSMDADGIIFAKKCRCGFLYESESELIQHAYQVGAKEALEAAADRMQPEKAPAFVVEIERRAKVADFKSGTWSDVFTPPEMLAVLKDRGDWIARHGTIDELRIIKDVAARAAAVAPRETKD